MTKQLQLKIDYSIAMLRRYEKLAKLYDPEEGFYLAFSGGKDSQCLYHIAQMAGVQFKAHMAMTSVDPVARRRNIVISRRSGKAAWNKLSTAKLHSRNTMLSDSGEADMAKPPCLWNADPSM